MFDKLFKKKVDGVVPQLPQDRFSFMSWTEQLAFEKGLTEYIHKSHPDFVINFAEGFVQGDDGMVYGLDNVAQSYNQAEKGEKKDIVKNHFEGLLRSMKESKDFEKKVRDFSAVKKFLAVRMYPIDYIQHGEDAWVMRQDLENIFTVLVFDLPSQVINVKPEYLKAWGKKKDELFEIALKNTFTNNPVELVRQDLSDTSYVWAILAESLFVSTYVLNLKAYPQMIGKYGSVVIVPRRQTVVVHPIDDLSVIETINKMVGIANGMYNDGPGSLTPQLYWYHKDTFTNLPYTLDKNKFNFTPPAKFVETLNKLK